MSDPVTLASLGALAFSESVKFLYGQAAELLKARRERKGKNQGEPGFSGINVSLDSGTPSFDAELQPIEPDLDVLEAQNQRLSQLVGAIEPFIAAKNAIDKSDMHLVQNAEEVRRILEAILGQRITFVGESREPTGTTVSVDQALGTVDGLVTGVEADSVENATVSVNLKADGIGPQGSVTGAKLGRIGGN